MDLDSLLKSIREENKGGAIVPAKFFGEDRYDKYYHELITEGRIEGENLSSDERREGRKLYKKGKIDFETFVNKVLKTRDEIKKQEPEKETSNLDLPALPGSATSAIVKRDSVNIEKFKPEPVSEGTQQNFDDILNGIDSILDTLREENKLKKKESRKEARKDEEKKRKKQEDKLEKNPFKKLGGVVDKMLKPVKGIWERMWDFIWNVFLGRTLMKLIDWFSDKENKGKLDAIGVFLKNTWPGLLAVFLAFGTGLGGFITGLIRLIGGFIPKLMGLIPKMLKGLKTVALGNPLATAAVAVAAGTAIAAVAANQDGTAVVKDPKDPDKSQADEIREFGGMTADPMSGDMFSDLPEESPQEFKEGGRVPGSGPNKDTVRAMLTPGEFVMSRGAVEKYGTDTLESMNSAGGGNNRPQTKEGTFYAQGGGHVHTKPENNRQPSEKQPDVPSDSVEEKKDTKTKSSSGGSLLGGIKRFFGFGGNDKKEKEKEKTSAGGGGFSEDSLRKAMDDAGYTDKTERAMFLAQMAHESGNFRYDEEIASGEAYEGREDLGNTEPGDGVKYKGRGYIQLTGRANYEHYGNKLGVDLVGDPDLAKKPDIAAKVAVAYWNERVDRNAARAGDVRKVTYNINGGYNGLEDRANKFRNYMKDPNYKVPSGGVISSGSSGSSGGGYSGGSSGGGSSGGGSGGGYGGMKSSVVLARKGGVEGKLDKSTGKWTAGDWSKQEKSRYTNFGGKDSSSSMDKIIPKHKKNKRGSGMKNRSSSKMKLGENPKKSAPEPPSQSQPSVTSAYQNSSKKRQQMGRSAAKKRSEANSIGPKHQVPRESAKAKTLGALV